MKRLSLLLTALCVIVPAAGETPSYDIVVYGGTSGAVTAAVQAAKDGRSVVLVSPVSHVGGLTISGLGWTDLGQSSILGGLSREFYHRIYQHYQSDTAWNLQTRASYGNAGQGGQAFNATTEVGAVFEPKVAEAVFTGLLQENAVPVVTGKLDLANGVKKTGKKITGIRLTDGREIDGKMFIDASYEGDLLPGAGVSFTVGREANATYGETVNGIQTAGAVKNQLRDNIDPYVTPGNAASGLLSGVEAANSDVDGTADNRLQAYCYRMVLTDVAANRVAVTKPAGYQESDYELLFRSIEAGQTAGFFKFDLMPNRKTDSNNTGGISTDYIGGNYGTGWNWTTLNHEQRAALAAKHRDWQLGLVWTLQNSTRVPTSIRTNYANWGLPADEFTDNGHWPYDLYVREARRMVSGYVMTQANCTGAIVAEDSVGLAAYAMDSHNTRRQVRNGMVKNEGDIQLAVAGAYPVSYRSLVPKATECENLLVPWSLSASHMAFGSIRMEPVFMTLSQSAAIAADLALDQGSTVQAVIYSQLRPRLTAAGQALGAAPGALPSVSVDNSNSSLVTVTGDWLAASSTAGFIGADYLHDQNAGKGAKSVFYRLPAGSTGQQRVFIRWTAHTNRATNVPVEVRHAGGVATFTLNQQIEGGAWKLLGTYSFTGAATEGVYLSNTGTNGYVIADGVGFAAYVEDPNQDTDGDGLTDAQETVLGLDPNVSDAAFIAAVKSHPEYFGLHAVAEIQELRLTAPRLTRPTATSSAVGFDLQEWNNAWQTRESLLSTTPDTGAKGFFRLETP